MQNEECKMFNAEARILHFALIIFHFSILRDLRVLVCFNSYVVML
jgi:hypothetical protein